MSDVFSIRVSPDRVIQVRADSPQEAAAGARKVLENEQAGTSDKVAQAFGQGASMGFGDELTAGVRAAAPGLSNWMMRGPELQRDESIGGAPQPQTVSSAPTMQGRYDEELQRERDKAKAFHETNPYLATGANIAGGLATTALALPASFSAVGPSAVGNMAKMGAVGAGIGGATAFGEGEGLEDRLYKGALGAGTGAILGAATRPVAALAQSLAESAPGRFVLDPATRLASAWAGRAAAPNPTAEAGAVQKLATQLQRSRMTVPQAQAEVGRLGDEAILSDVSPDLLQLGVNTKTLGGETRQRAQDFFDPRVGQGRDARTAQRMVRAAEGSEPPPSNFDLRGEGRAFDSNVRAVGRGSYQGDMAGAGLHMPPELDKLMVENPTAKGALKSVMDSITEASKGRPDFVPPSPVEIMHMVKQELQGLGFDKMTGKPLPTQQVWREFADNFVSKLKAGNPELAKADTAYAQAKSLPEFYDAGTSLFAKGTGEKAREASAPALAEMLANADAQQRLAGRAGATNALRARAETLAGARGAARDIKQSGTEGIEGKIRELYSPQQAENLVRQAGTEGIFANTSNRYQGGPHTADDLVGAGDLSGLSVRATPGGGIIPRLTESYNAVKNWVTSPNEAVRNEIGRMLIDPNPDNQRRTFELLARALAARAAGSPVSAGAAGAGGAAGASVFGKGQ